MSIKSVVFWGLVALATVASIVMVISITLAYLCKDTPELLHLFGKIAIFACFTVSACVFGAIVLNAHIERSEEVRQFQLQ